MKADIASAADVRRMVEEFYTTLTADPMMAPFFADLDLEAHLPRIRAFWEMVLLDKAGYTTNVTAVHLAIAQRMSVLPAHFERWLALWATTVDALFSGPKAEEAKSRAHTIAMVIRSKMGT